MEPYAEMGCVLKVNVHCGACKMKMMEILGSICGVYSVTIDAQEGTVKVSGEVNPNILLRALARSGKHAELIWVKLKHPDLTRSSYNNHDNYGALSYGHGYGPHTAIDDGHRYSRSLPENSWYDTNQHYPPRRRPVVEYPWYSTNYGYGSQLPPATYVASGPVPPVYEPYDDESINVCSIM